MHIRVLPTLAGGRMGEVTRSSWSLFCCWFGENISRHCFLSTHRIEEQTYLPRSVHYYQKDRVAFTSINCKKRTISTQPPASNRWPKPLTPHYPSLPETSTYSLSYSYSLTDRRGILGYSKAGSNLIWDCTALHHSSTSEGLRHKSEWCHSL